MGYPPLTQASLETIDPALLPLLILTDNEGGGFWGFVAGRIRAHTKSNYSHAMIMHKPGLVSTQDWRYQEEPIGKWFDGKHRIKAWYCPTWTKSQRAAMLFVNRIMLQQRGKYDWVGIIGQALKIPRFNIGKRNYCSEAVARVLRTLYTNIPFHPSPGDLDRWAIMRNEMKVLGVYDPFEEQKR